MHKKFSLFAFVFIAAICLSLSSAYASNYSKTKTKNVTYGSQCTGKISDKATVNSDSLDWSFSLSGTTVSSQNGYSFAKPYSNSVTYTNARKTASHSVGYYFYNSLGNNVGGSLTTINFYYNGSNSIS